MLRAVPVTVRIADSRFVVLRSTSLILAISSTCFFVTLPTLLRFGSAEPFAMIRCALQQNRSRRRLQNEGERAVGVDRHEHRENHSVRLLLRLGVELFAEIHDVQAVWTERRADWRRRSRFARRKLQLDRRLNLLCHVPASTSFLRLSFTQPSFSTLAKSNSTGVERPKIVTDTFNRL